MTPVSKKDSRRGCVGQAHMTQCVHLLENLKVGRADTGPPWLLDTPVAVLPVILYGDTSWDTRRPAVCCAFCPLASRDYDPGTPLCIGEDR